MKKKRLLVYSVDALIGADLAYLSTLPHFGRFLSHASGPEHLVSIYPSVTYPAHVTMQTGCYPDRHGVYCNNLFSLKGHDLDWTWDSRLIRTDTVFSAAKRAGYTTGCAFWPVTAYNPDIDFNMPEYWLAHPDDTLRETFMEMGASEQIAEIMQRNDRFLAPGYRLTGMENVAAEPEFDRFMIHTACDIIRACAPEVMFLHGSLVDSMRHGNGVFGPKINEALELTDTWLGMLEAALRDAGVYDDTNIVIMSDHGQRDISRVTRPNAYLASRGYITLDAAGNVTDWKIFGISNGMSMTFWLKDPDDPALYNEALSVLRDMAAKGICGAERVFTRQEAAELHHLDGDFSFVLESDGSASFADARTLPIEGANESKDYRTGRATHGYLPEKGPHPVFLAAGPDIVPDVHLPFRQLTDAAPTFAAILGVQLRDAEGAPMLELLKKE